MHPRCAINASFPQKNFKLLLQRKFCCIPNQSLTQPAGRFIPSSQAGSNAVFFNHVKFMLLRYQNLWKVRNFSSSRTLSALKGSNRFKEEREAKILYASLTLVVLLVVCLAVAIKPHEDYVVIKAEAGK